MNDYFEDFEHLKTPMKTYWNLHGPKVDRHVLQLFGIPWRHNGIVMEWLVEWYGGVDAINSIISKYDNKIYRANAFNMGTYEFKFKINDLKLGNSDYIISYNAIVDGSGEIEVTDDDGNTFHTIYDAYINDDMEWGWEIKDETGTTLLSESDGYVPNTLCPNKNGYGDYIKMTIDENGVIQNWKFKISDFIEED